MRRAWVLATLALLPNVLVAQATAVLRVEVTLRDGAQAPTPVPRHALLISDTPPTGEPRRVLTGADGTVQVTLRPGLYTVESDRPVTFQGKAYQWTEMLDIIAGRDVTVRLTADNAEVVPLDALASAATEPAASDSSFLFAKWQGSVVAVWSPTSRASGFLIDDQGLVATDGGALGDARSVEVQWSESSKSSARVLFSGSSSAAAIVRVDPSLASGRLPVPLDCKAKAPSLREGEEISTLMAPLRRPKDQTWGEVTGFSTRAVDTDLRVAFGGAGGPVFDAAGALVGLTTVQAEAEGARRRDVAVVRAGILCEAVAAAQAAMADSPPPEATHLPVEPQRPFAADAFANGTSNRSGETTPLAVTSSDFDLAFITPPMVYAAQQRADRTGGASTRSPEAEARLGRLTDFGAWSEYFADVPPVLVVRVTPKLVEGFWKRLGREAARTQGVQLPPLKGFKASFLRLRASCGTSEVTPIHPFVLEHRLSDDDTLREGLYVFAPDAFGPHCGTVTLVLQSDEARDREETITVETGVIDRIWQDFASYRASGG